MNDREHRERCPFCGRGFHRESQWKRHVGDCGADPKVPGFKLKLQLLWRTFTGWLRR